MTPTQPRRTTGRRYGVNGRKTIMYGIEQELFAENGEKRHLKMSESGKKNRFELFTFS